MESPKKSADRGLQFWMTESLRSSLRLVLKSEPPRDEMQPEFSVLPTGGHLLGTRVGASVGTRSKAPHRFEFTFTCPCEMNECNYTRVGMRVEPLKGKLPTSRTRAMSGYCPDICRPKTWLINLQIIQVGSTRVGKDGRYICAPFGASSI